MTRFRQIEKKLGSEQVLEKNNKKQKISEFINYHELLAAANYIQLGTDLNVICKLATFFKYCKHAVLDCTWQTTTEMISLWFNNVKTAFCNFMCFHMEVNELRQSSR